MAIFGFFADLKALILEWVWILLAVAAAVAFLASAIAHMIPWLKSWAGAALIVGVVLTAVSANIQGRAASSAHARLVETKRQLREAQDANFRQAAEIEQQRRIARENDAALVRLSERMMAAEADATAARAEIDALEKNDADVADYLARPVPPALRRVLIKPDASRR